VGAVRSRIACASSFRLVPLDARDSGPYARGILHGCHGGFTVPKLNENICAQIERAAQLLRGIAGKKITARQVGRGGVPNRPDLQEFVDTAASLEALVKRSRRQ
jgi:hypothetical protein